jgi:outer membrane protein assembly factor BamA
MVSLIDITIAKMTPSEQVMRATQLSCLGAGFVILCLATTARAQEAPKRVAKGWELFALPALNFASDEGVGYGALAEIYNYGNGVQPYRFTIRPVVFLTTKGRRDFVVSFDAPKLLPNNWRLDGFLGREQQIATPYYGVGNDAAFVEQNEQPPNAYFYRYGRTAVRVFANLQHRLGSLPARGLFGAGYADLKTDATPFDSGTTLFRQDFGSAPLRGKIGYVRTGLIWDTRDREIAPHSGSYGDLLVQRVDKALGATSSYTRLTGIFRKYFPLTAKLVLAQRALLQQTDGDVPVYDLSSIQTSSGQNEGLGGSTSIRGLPKNRFVGKGIALLNSEMRWRFHEFELRRKPAYLTASAFADVGRVWTESIRPGEILSDLHAGYGAGIRLGLGPSFAVGLDVSRSPDSKSTQIYIGLGYPF